MMKLRYHFLGNTAGHSLLSLPCGCLLRTNVLSGVLFSVNLPNGAFLQRQSTAMAGIIDRSRITGARKQWSLFRGKSQGTEF